MCTPHFSNVEPALFRHPIPCKVRVAVLATLISLTSITCLGQADRPLLLAGSQSDSATPTKSTASTQGISELSDGPISPGETVHVMVFDAPDFSTVMRVSESGDIAIPMLGAIHIEGISSATASALIAKLLKTQNLMTNPHVTVTVDSFASGITVLGEVHMPGIYPLPGKHKLSDLLAAAGGLTSNTGRVIEISNDRMPEKKTYVPWDPTMRNTSNYDRPVHPGDRVFVRPCGIAYVGGNVRKPGAFSLCGFPQMTVSEVVALAGGVAPMSAQSHTFLIHAQANGIRVARRIDIKKVLEAKVADPIVQDDDIIYVSPSAAKEIANRALGYAMGLAGPLIYVMHP